MSASGLSFSVQTKFMQGYRNKSAFTSGQHLSLMKNSNEETEVFTIGNNGAVINVFPSAESATGYASVDTGLTGNVIATGHDSDGNYIVFASSGNTLSFVYKNKEDKVGSWHDREAADLSALKLQPGDIITGIAAKRIDGQLYVALQVTIKGAAPDKPYFYAYAGDWKTTSTGFTGASFGNNAPGFQWIGTTRATAALIVVSPDLSHMGDSEFYEHTMATGDEGVAAWPKSNVQPFVLGDVTAAARSSDQFAYFFTVLQSGLAASYDGAYDALWEPIFPNTGKLHQIRAKYDITGRLHVFASSQENGPLWHTWRDVGSSADWSDPVQIAGNVAWFNIKTDDEGDVELFTLADNSSQLTHLVWSEADDQWNSEPANPTPIEQIEEFEGYNTDVTITDSDGNPLGNEKVEVRCTVDTELVINENVYQIGPDSPVTTTTNVIGGLVLVQPTQTLGVAAISISLPKRESPPTVLRQYVGIQNKLARLTADDLKAAKDASGNSILSSQYQSKAGDIASAANSAMGLAAFSRPLSSHGLGAPGVGQCERADFPGIETLQPPGEYRPWQFDVSSGEAAYRQLSADALESIHKSLGGLPSWLGTLGDFIQSVANGIYRATGFIVEKVAQGIKASITFVVDGVEKILTAIIKSVQDAFDLVEAVFASVTVKFRKLFEWLAFLFDWDNILRTKDVLSYLFEQQMEFLVGAVDGIRDDLKKQMSVLSQKSDAAFDRAIKEYGGQGIGSFVKTNEEPLPAPAAQGMSNNILMQHIICKPLPAALDPVATFDSSVKALAQQLATDAQTTSASLEKSAAYQQLQKTIEANGHSTAQFLGIELADLLRLLKDLSSALISGSRSLIDQMLNLLKHTLVVINKDILSVPLNIPFLSAFYRQITGGANNPSIIDLVALVGAIPCTAIWTAAAKTAPFPDQKSVDQLKKVVTAQQLLAASGLDKGSRIRLAKQLAAGLSPEHLRWCRFVSAIFSAVAGFIGAITGLAAEIKFISVQGVYILLRFFSSILGCPWFDPIHTSAIGFDNKLAYLNLYWIVQLLSPIAGFALIVAGRLGWVYSGEIVKFLIAVVGVITLGIAVTAVIYGCMSFRDIALWMQITTGLGGVAIVLAFKAVAKATAEQSAVVFIFVSLVCATIPAVRNMIAFMPTGVEFEQHA